MGKVNYKKHVHEVYLIFFFHLDSLATAFNAVVTNASTVSVQNQKLKCMF